MAGLAHAGIGLAAKRIAPGVPVGILVLAAIAIDLVWFIFFFTGLENQGNVFLSHGLFMSAVWSIAALFAARIISRSWKTGIVIGLLVFSHWVLDFISHPMYFMKDPGPDLPLLFDGSPKVGLGLYKTGAGVMITEFGTMILGAAVYIMVLVKKRREKKEFKAG